MLKFQLVPPNDYCAYYILPTLCLLYEKMMNEIVVHKHGLDNKMGGGIHKVTCAYNFEFF